MCHTVAIGAKRTEIRYRIDNAFAAMREWIEMVDFDVRPRIICPIEFVEIEPADNTRCPVSLNRQPSVSGASLINAAHSEDFAPLCVTLFPVTGMGGPLSLNIRLCLLFRHCYSRIKAELKRTCCASMTPFARLRFRESRKN